MSRVKKTLKDKSLYSKFMELKVQYKVGSIIVLLTVIWFSSSLFIKEGNQKNKINSTAEQISVQVKDFHAQEKTVYLSLTGTTEPMYSVDVIPEVSGQVLDIFVHDGDKVVQGGTLLKVEEYEKREQLEQAQAVLKQRELEYEAAQSLNEKGYRSEIQASASFAALQAAQADVKKSQLSWENTKIKIPLSGYIDKINVQKGDFVSPSNSIAKVVNFDQIRIVTYISEKDVNKVKLNSTADIVLADGKSFTANVSFISRVINQITRTYRVELVSPLSSIKDYDFPVQGITADIKIPVRSAKAHKIPASALSLSDDGTIGVKVVDLNNIVSFVPIEIIDDEEDGLWVANAPDTIKLITLGHAYVNSGAEVKINS